jgi:hypothetical protein
MRETAPAVVKHAKIDKTACASRVATCSQTNNLGIKAKQSKVQWLVQHNNRVDLVKIVETTKRR